MRPQANSQAINGKGGGSWKRLALIEGYGLTQHIARTLQEVPGIGKKRGHRVALVIMKLLAEEKDPGRMIVHHCDEFYAHWQHIARLNSWQSPSVHTVRALREWWIQDWEWEAAEGLSS
jgi:hypothetical protein